MRGEINRKDIHAGQAVGDSQTSFLNFALIHPPAESRELSRDRLTPSTSPGSERRRRRGTSGRPVAPATAPREGPQGNRAEEGDSGASPHKLTARSPPPAARPAQLGARPPDPSAPRAGARAREKVAEKVSAEEKGPRPRRPGEGSGEEGKGGGTRSGRRERSAPVRAGSRSLAAGGGGGGGGGGGDSPPLRLCSPAGSAAPPPCRASPHAARAGLAAPPGRGSGSTPEPEAAGRSRAAPMEPGWRQRRCLLRAAAHRDNMVEACEAVRGRRAGSRGSPCSAARPRAAARSQPFLPGLEPGLGRGDPRRGRSGGSCSSRRARRVSSRSLSADKLNLRDFGSGPFQREYPFCLQMHLHLQMAGIFVFDS
ncbi:translation initiation factor IF-2-like [Pipra filicauda]|uniref:Translation initiation factor IF-2-like n=1 Tax=Pipra filicauda TaxID=649802 RepID=A0A6J2HIW9_9PASS|nr:translation initiation factor IF-2-like [Pipra filicauda]